MKKVYSAPHVKTEKVEMGVFGNYGGDCQPIKDLLANPVKKLASFFKVLCCQ